MELRDVTVATMTRVRGQADERRITRTLTQLASLGLTTLDDFRNWLIREAACSWRV